MCDSLDGNHTICKSRGLPRSVIIMSDYQLGLFMILTISRVKKKKKRYSCLALSTEISVEWTGHFL